MQAGDLPLAMTLVSRWPLPRHHQQRVREAVADDRRHEERGTSPSARRSTTRSSGSSGIPTGTRLFSSGGSQNTVNVLKWNDGRLDPSEQITISAPGAHRRLVAARERRLRRRLAMRARRQDALRRAGASVRPWSRWTSTRASSRRRSRSAPSPTPSCCRRTARLFVSLWGGAQGPRVRRRHARAARARSPSASTRTRWRCRRTAPPVRGVRQHQRGVGDRRRVADREGADRRRAVSARRRSAPRPTPSPCRPTARRCSSPTPTTTRWPSSTSRTPDAARSRASSRRAGIRPRVSFDQRRQAHLRAQRQGPDELRQPARPGAGQPRRGQASTPGAMLQGALSMLPMPDKDDARGAHEARLQL